MRALDLSSRILAGTKIAARIESLSPGCHSTMSVLGALAGVAVVWSQGLRIGYVGELAFSVLPESGHSETR